MLLGPLNADGARDKRRSSRARSVLGLLLLPGVLCAAVTPTPELTQPDWPMYGGGPTRNAIRPGADAPVRWSVRQVGDELSPGLNIKWLARTGHGFAMSSPVIANGYVWVGTNNQTPRDPARREPARTRARARSLRVATRSLRSRPAARGGRG